MVKVVPEFGRFNFHVNINIDLSMKKINVDLKVPFESNIAKNVTVINMLN